MLIGSSIAGLISLALANLIVLSEIKKRRIAQNDLIASNEGLEKNIEQRTIELKDANDKLKEIGSEREAILLNEQNARKEAEIANRLRDEFMATVSHELRTPLTRMTLALGIARRSANSEIHPALDRMEREADKLNQLISRVIAINRLEATGDPVTRQAIDLNELVMQ